VAAERARRALLAVGLLLALGGPAPSRTESNVAPDRPGVTDNTQTVPFGAFQIEAGLLFARTSAAASPFVLEFSSLEREGIHKPRRSS